MEVTINENNKHQKIKNIFNRCFKIWNKIWNSKLLTFTLLVLVFGVTAAIVLGIASYRGGILHMNSDDILQYYPYIAGLFDKIKHGKLSLYDTTLYGGTSFFGSVYYLPFDIFTLFAFLLSYLVEAETAYCIANFLKPVCGAFLLYYFLARKGFNTKVIFVTSVIYMIGGITETYYIFPVYLGINFYAPLAMIIIDWCIEKKGVYYFLLSIYSVVVILYDFYMAYMLLAFACIYFIIAMHISDEFSFFGKNTIIKNKSFWIRFFEFMFFLLAGVCISAFFLLPSAFYVLNESSRNGSDYGQDKFNFYYAMWDKDKSAYTISLRHYFTQWCNIFIPNEPHRFCLNDAGDYMREHATLYITSGGLIYFVYFFFINGKLENRLKFWVIIFNIFFMMPLFAKIFCFNEIPYSRWFFIPYILNIYAASIAMNKNNFKLSNNIIINIFPFITMLLGIGTLSYVLITNTKNFIHYSQNDLFYYPLLVGGIVCLAIYTFFMIIDIIFKKTNLKIKNLFKNIMPLIIFCECIFAGLILFTNTFNANSNYFNNKKEMTSMKNELYDKGFTDEAGYRINLYTNAAKQTTNANVLIRDVNFGRFFQSFYNTPLTVNMKYIYHDDFQTSWSRSFNGGYSLMSSNIFNVKYIVSHKNNAIKFPEKYYKLISEKDNFYYYESINMSPFIVYDKMIDQIPGNCYAIDEALPLFYGYTPCFNGNPNPESNSYQDDINTITLHQRYLDLGMEFTSKTSSADIISKYFTKEDTLSSVETVSLNNEDYYKFELKNRTYKDVIHIYPTNSDIRRNSNETIFVEDQDNKLHATHYNTFFKEDIIPKYIYVKKDNKQESTSIKVSSYSYEVIDLFYSEQAKYTNKYFKLDGDKMTLSCVMPDNSKTRIIKTGYTYSDDWKIKTNGYETINIDGGFLGIVVDKNITNVDVTLEYEPAGYKMGLIISILACIGMGLIGVITLFFIINKNKIIISDEKKELFNEIIRFLVVGAIVTLCDYILFYLSNLVIFKGLSTSLNLALSTIIGFTVGLIVNWLLQKFVFKYVDESQTKSKKVFIKFIIISLIGLGITELGMLLAAPLFNKVVITFFVTFDLIKLLMKILMTCIVLVFNYLGRKFIVFKK